MKSGHKIENPELIKEYYRKEDVAKNYIDIRFKQPMYAVAHKNQIEIINRYTQNRDLLEIACGPARLTSEIKAKSGMSIDSSEE
ncbi:MAG: hypothetical protein KJ601_01565, partial [Nanoarchaeota archaeon]|nr:hypothetical protein [Nanoarchaeota archaeon]